MSQIFKEDIPINMLIELLQSINKMDTNKMDTIKYIINKESYKRGLCNGSIDAFIKQCFKYYHLSKQRYLEKKLTYNSFTTIIRQICNHKKIPFTKDIKYFHSSYDICYIIEL